MSAQIDALKSQLRKRTMAFFFAVFVGVIVLAAITVAAYQVSLNNRAAIKEFGRKFCTSTAAQAAPNPKPSTARGEALQESAQDLLQDLDCTARASAGIPHPETNKPIGEPTP
ncbi:hypothetical protein [Kineosporia babensis]|uniref:Uncharacterized protein n=1 Tax=Kineosporia babensis TaxID=499548 RepID=A0A9X1SY79_9ACTN|nr:hypothetical protein [Kineosporia babensis]MCD5310783.1 hypothetical protein [Kineosporia babensis]